MNSNGDWIRDGVCALRADRMSQVAEVRNGLTLAKLTLSERTWRPAGGWLSSCVLVGSGMTKSPSVLGILHAVVKPPALLAKIGREPGKVVG